MYEAIHVVRKSISNVNGLIQSTTGRAMHWQCTGNAKLTGSIPIDALLFFRLTLQMLILHGMVILSFQYSSAVQCNSL